MTKLSECRAMLAGKATELSKAQADLAACEVGSALKSDQIAVLTTQRDKLAAEVADLQAQLDAATPPEPPSDPFRAVPLGANLQAEVKMAGPNARLQLPAKLDITQTVTPLPGQWLRGPCVLVGKGVLDCINLKSADSKGVTLEKLDISGSNRTGVVVWTDAKLIGCHLHHNPLMGCGGNGEGIPNRNVLVRSCEIDHNGSVAEVGHGAAGIKVFQWDGITVDDCDVHDNVGNGVWGDAQCGEITVTGSRIYGNARKGVFYEKGGEGFPGFDKSKAPLYDGMFTVTGNAIHDNNTETPRSSSHAGVTMAASKHGRIFNNTYGGNLRAIYVYNDSTRVADDKPGFVVSDVELTYTQADLNGDEVKGCDVAGVTCR